MTLQEFQQSIREGIPAELPAPKPYDPEVNHAPKRKDILTKEAGFICIGFGRIMKCTLIIYTIILINVCKRLLLC